jgi:hypothetical protein
MKLKFGDPRSISKRDKQRGQAKPRSDAHKQQDLPFDPDAAIEFTNDPRCDCALCAAANYETWRRRKIEGVM